MCNATLLRLICGSRRQKSTKALCAVYGAGLSGSGALAIPSIVVPPRFVKAPRRIAALNIEEICFVASGFGFSLFASKKKVFGSGLNNLSQIVAGGSNAGQDYYIAKKRIHVPDIDEIRSISAGRAHSLVSSAEKVYAFGHNVHAQCAHDPSIEIVNELRLSNFSSVAFPSSSKIAKVHCSLDTSFVLTADGKVFAWGLNEDGQCANGMAGIQEQPAEITGDAVGEKIVDITGSTDTIVATSDKGDIFVWGQNEYYQSCYDDSQLKASRHVPLNCGKIVSAATTACSCVAVNTEGTVFVWGTQYLGLGPRITDLKQPTPLDPPLFNNQKVVRVFAGNTCAAALTDQGSLFIWGQNRFGQIALDSDKDQLFPLQIYFPRDVVDVALGTDHSLFLTK